MKTFAGLLMVILLANSAWAEGKSRVVRVVDPGAVVAGEFEAGRVRALVSQGIQALTSQTNDAAAWATLVSSNDIVGLKVATQAAPLQCSRVAVVDAIADGLLAAGVSATNIIVWDRDTAKLRAAGFVSGPKYQVRAVVGDTGWDADQVYESRVVGKLIWGDLMHGREEEDYSSRSHLPQLLTRTLTKLINVPVLQDNEACGVGGCLYNVTVGLVDNARRFEIVGQRGEADIAQLALLPAIRGKLILNVMDALVAGYAGGPAFKPQYSWSPGMLYFSRDAVAVDALAVADLETPRAAARVPPIGDRAIHIAVAARAGLGVAEREQIELIEPALPNR